MAAWSVLIFRPAAQTHPAERSVPVIEQQRPHEVFHVGGKNETIQGINAVPANLLDAGVKDRLHEAVAVVEKVGAPLHQGSYQVEVAGEGVVHQFPEPGMIGAQQFGALSEGQPLGAIAAVISRVAGGLIGEEVDGYLPGHGIFEQIDDVPVIGDGCALPFALVFFGQLEGCSRIVTDLPDPSLLAARPDPGIVHFGDEADPVGDFSGPPLRSAHSAKARRNVEDPAHISSARRQSQLETAGIEHGAVGPVDNSLRTDIHPPAGGHLAVVGNPEGGRPVPVLLVVEPAHHEAVGNDHPR